MRSLLMLVIGAAVVVAGCITPPAVDTASAPVTGTFEEVYSAVRSLIGELPCDATTVGASKTSDNLLDLAAVGYDDSDHGEIDIAGDWMLAARYAAGGFEVVSIADPLNPVYVSIYQTEESNAQDVKFMPDGRSAVVGVNSHIELVDLSPVMGSPVAMSEMMDREVFPTLISTWEFPGSGLFTNMHMLTTARIGDVDYVFVAPNNDSGFWVLKLTGEGAERVLETVGNFGAPLNGGPLGPHDMSLVHDEILDKPLLYVANGFEGWMVYDMSNPEAPARLAAMPNLGIAQGYTHTALGQKVGDRRLVITIAEVGSNVMNVFDATNFAAPVLLAQWWADKTNPMLPQHNIQLVNGTLYVAHYTLGVYVFDLNKLGDIPLVGSVTLAPVAHWMPTNPEDGGSLGFANTWDVIVHNGLLYINDSSGHGTAVVAYGCLSPGDVTATSKN